MTVAAIIKYKSLDETDQVSFKMMDVCVEISIWLEVAFAEDNFLCCVAFFGTAAALLIGRCCNTINFNLNLNTCLAQQRHVTDERLNAVFCQSRIFSWWEDCSFWQMFKYCYSWFPRQPRPGWGGFKIILYYMKVFLCKQYFEN